MARGPEQVAHPCPTVALCPTEVQHKYAGLIMCDQHLDCLHSAKLDFPRAEGLRTLTQGGQPVVHWLIRNDALHIVDDKKVGASKLGIW